jgi:hypothetical protein
MEAAKPINEIVSRKKDERASSRTAKVRRGSAEGTDMVNGSGPRRPTMPRPIPPKLPKAADP